MTLASDSSSGASQAAGTPVFPETLWTLVSAAGGPASAPSEAALRQLCERYRDPIVRRLLGLGYGQEAEDLANGFVEFLLERNRLENFARGETKFRSFLLKCLKGFLRDEWRKNTAGKRGGGAAPASFDEMEIGREPAFDQLLDRQFALSIHRRVMERLAAEAARKGDAERFAGLQPYVLGGDGAASYADIGTRLGLTANNVKVAVLRLRGRYSDLFREETLPTVTRTEVDEEMRYLIPLLADTEATLGR